ncbi:MAG TPA: flagellar basal body rod protein FlgB [Oscillatoriaceae cyanobacterium]
MDLLSPTLAATARAMDGMSLRHEAIADNIANINTPGYVKQTVNFEDSLREALNEAQAPSGATDGSLPETGDGAFVTAAPSDVLLTWQPKMTQAPDGPQRLDGNQVAIEKEMSAMTENAEHYQTIAQVLSKEFTILKTIAQAK